MLKKCVLMLFMILLSLCTSVCAESYRVEFETMPEFLTVAEYSEDLISDLKILKPEEAKFYYFETKASKFSAYLIYKDAIEKVTPFIVPEESEVIPELYETEKDAFRAGAVLDSVLVTEDGYELNVYFHGELKTFEVADDFTVWTAPKQHSGLEGAPLSELKRGDIIWIVKNFKTPIEAIALLFRPEKENVIFSAKAFGDGFSSLFSNEGMILNQADYKILDYKTKASGRGYEYGFGVITDYRKGELELRDKNGKALLIDVADNAFVYIINASEKFEIETGKPSSIKKSTAVRNSIDEEGNFIEWEKDASYNYAFVRLIDGVATEVVVYKDYE